MSKEDDQAVEQPPNVYFADLVGEWGVAVARWIAWLAQQDGATFAWRIDECWADDHAAVGIRYAYQGRRLATFFEDVEIDPLSGSALPPFPREHASGSSAQQASNLYHGTFDAQGYVAIEWTDPLGYGWWGAEPKTGWAAAVVRRRLATVLERPSI